MCKGCVIEYLDGSGDADTVIEATYQRPPVRAAAEQVTALYDLPHCEVGGPLHVVVDDYNVDDEFIDRDDVDGAVAAWVHDHNGYAFRDADVIGVYEAVAIADQTQRVLDALAALQPYERACAVHLHAITGTRHA